MTGVDKRSLSERVVRMKLVTPASRDAGPDAMHQLREEVALTEG